jgi:hypothetical protein
LAVFYTNSGRMPASPEADIFKNSNKFKAWVNDSCKFLIDEFGKDNVKKINLHMDETTPHIHVLIIPKKDKKLNYKHFLGGSKYRLSEFQTDYAKRMEKYGLERGKEGSKAKHQDVKKFYNALNTKLEKELPEPGLLETKKTYKERANKEYQKINLKNLDLEEKMKRLKQHIPNRKISTCAISINSILYNKILFMQLFYLNTN